MAADSILNKRDLGLYLTAKMNEHKITEATLAEYVGKDQKSINRYKHGQNKPDEYTLNKIFEFFDKLEAGSGSIEEVLKKAKEENLRFLNEAEMKSYEEAEEEFLRHMWDGATSSGLRIYTPRTQKFIVKYLALFINIEDDEIKYVESMKVLREKRPDYWNKVIKELENMQMSFDAFVRLDIENDEDDSSPYVKMDMIKRLVCDREDCLKGSLHNKREMSYRSFGDFSEMKRYKCEEKFDEIIENYYYRTGTPVRDDLFALLEDKYLKYIDEDWYALYLYNRMKMLDYSDPYSVYRRIEEEKITREREFRIRYLMKFLFDEIKEEKKE